MSIDSTNCPIEKQKLKSKLEENEVKVTTLMADRNAEMVKEQLSQINSTDGNFNQARIWKVKNKILPRPKVTPWPKKTEEEIWSLPPFL